MLENLQQVKVSNRDAKRGRSPSPEEDQLQLKSSISWDSFEELLDGLDEKEKAESLEKQEDSSQSHDRSSDVDSPSVYGISKEEHKQLQLKLQLGQDDWDLILSGAECKAYLKDEKILAEGYESDCIYQIGNGICRVEKNSDPDSPPIVLGTMTDSELFGEIGFLTNSGASASVIADENHVNIYCIKRDHIEELISIDPAMAGRFYKFLCLVLARRIRQRELEQQLRLNNTSDEDVFLTNLPAQEE